MSKKAADVQRKTFRKPGELLFKTTFKITRKSACLEGKYEEMRAGPGVLYRTV